MDEEVIDLTWSDTDEEDDVMDLTHSPSLLAKPFEDENHGDGRPADATCLDDETSTGDETELTACKKSMLYGGYSSSASKREAFSSDEPTDDETEQTEPIKYYNEKKSLPIFSTKKAGFSLDEIANVLVCQKIPDHQICHTQPVHISKNASFVVRLDSLDDPCDVRADEKGVWKRKGSPVVYISVYSGKADDMPKVIRRSRMGSSSSHFKVTRTYYRHSDSPDFSRIIITVHNHNNQLLPLALVKYKFDRSEHDIAVSSHGNAVKKNGPFKRTKPSTIRMLKEGMAGRRPPLQVLTEVESSRGGVMSATSSCELPRDRRQVYNLKHSSAKENVCIKGQSVKQSDVLAEVMYMCKQDERDGEQFIRSIEAAPEPMCVLCSNQQLMDLERFCAKSDFTVITADPTFNLGTFYITPISYKNLLMETGAGQSPVMLGPVLVHQTKQLRPFHYFASTLTRLCTNLVNIKAFGTDGEPELIKAFKMVFPTPFILDVPITFDATSRIN